MSQFKFINLDSKDASYVTNQTYNSYIFKNSVTELPNSYNAEWTFRKQILNPKRLWLKSLELPIGWCNVRANNGSNSITVSTSTTIGVNEFTISLPDTVYQEIDLLITDINAAFLEAYPATSILFSIIPSGASKGQLIVKSTTYANGSTVLYLRNGVLANDILGFGKDNLFIDPLFNNSPFAIRCASGKYLLNPDSYVNMYIPNISSGDSNVNGVPSSFKIPVLAINDTVMFSASNLTFDSYVLVDNIQVLNKLQIVILDRWGYNINSRGLDYSITFAVEI